MESHQSRTPLILPTLQSVLIHEWNDVLNALGDGNYKLAWERVQTYFEDVVPPDVEEECNVDYQKLKKIIEKSKMVKSIDTFCAASETYYNFTEVLSQELRAFMNKVKKSLFKNKWLTREGVSPRFNETRKLEVEPNGSEQQ